MEHFEDLRFWAEAHPEMPQAVKVLELFRVSAATIEAKNALVCENERLAKELEVAEKVRNDYAKRESSRVRGLYDAKAAIDKAVKEYLGAQPG